MADEDVRFEEFAENVNEYKRKRVALMDLLSQAKQLDAMTPENFQLMVNGLFEKHQAQKIANLKTIEKLERQVYTLRGRNRQLDKDCDLLINMLEGFNRLMRLADEEVAKTVESQRERVDQYLETAGRIEDINPKRAADLRKAAAVILTSLEERAEEPEEKEEDAEPSVVALKEEEKPKDNDLSVDVVTPISKARQR